MFVKVIYDADLRKRMGSFGRWLAEKKFSADKMVDQTLEVYKSLVA